jgi:hypothetical protein
MLFLWWWEWRPEDDSWCWIGQDEREWRLLEIYFGGRFIHVSYSATTRKKKEAQGGGKHYLMNHNEDVVLSTNKAYDERNIITKVILD